MNKRVKKIIALIILIALSTLVVSCQSSMRIRSILLKKTLDNKLIIVESYECNEPSFTVDGKIKLKEDEAARIYWVYTPNETILYDEKIYLEKENYFRSTINNGKYLWPIGEYRIDIKINNEIVKSLNFNVTQESKEKN